METSLDNTNLLDQTRAQLANGAFNTGMNSLALGLQSLRASLSPASWEQFIQAQVLPHPVTRLIHQSPFTGRAYNKPRGYPGDAVILDFIYGQLPVTQEEYGIGAQLYHQWEYQTPSCRSVRARRDLLAARVDALAERINSPKILSVACGHLREAQLARAVKEGRVGEYVGLDQDEDSLAVVHAEQQAHAVKAVKGSVRSLLTGRHDFSEFDLVYSAGLYDYLAEPVAIRLTQTLFRYLRAGGSLLIANFAPELCDIAYLEAFMDWRLIYRSEAEVERFASAIPPREISAIKTFREENGNIVFLEIVRA
jgi:extracellular factor (EF) 3-hydroxypalmitic acid methyl ester biosynthesis protein